MMMAKTEVAMVCLTVLEAIALVTNKDGAYFMPIVGLVSALGGAAAWPAVKKGIIALCSE